MYSSENHLRGELDGVILPTRDCIYQDSSYLHEFMHNDKQSSSPMPIISIGLIQLNNPKLGRTYMFAAERKSSKISCKLLAGGNTITGCHLLYGPA